MIAGVVLAAGAGTRIGFPKALLRTERSDESFVQRACWLLREAALSDIVIVTSGALLDHVRAMEPRARVVVNDAPERGQLSSLQSALGVAGPDTAAVVVLPVDVPLVQARTVRELLAVWLRTQAPVVRPVSGQRHGHPVIFARSLFAELATSPLSEGARPVVRRHVTPAGEVTIDDPGAFVDIDTVEEYKRAFNRLPEPVRIR